MGVTLSDTHAKDYANYLLKKGLSFKDKIIR